MSKSTYSLFGDQRKRYRRFLYHPYLPRSENEDGCIFDLTPETIRTYFDTAQNIAEETCKALISVLGGGHTVWPIDRFLITCMTHAMLYGTATGKVFLSQHGGDIGSFIAQHHKPECQQVPLVEDLLRFFAIDLVERALCTILKSKNIPITYDPDGKTLANTLSLYSQVRAKLGSVKRRVKSVALTRTNLGNICNKSLLLCSNSTIAQLELEKLPESIRPFSLDSWFSHVDTGLRKRMSSWSTQNQGKGSRTIWRTHLEEAAAKQEEGTLRQVLPLIADMYPVSLLEGRNVILEQVRCFVDRLSVRAEPTNRIVLLVDHGAVRFEWAGALAQALLEKGHFVVGQYHGPSGHFRCDLPKSTEQTLRTHFASVTKRPFILRINGSPQVIPVRLQKYFHPVLACKPARGTDYSIWFFPHHLPVHAEDGILYYFTNQIRPENYFEWTTAIINTFMTVAQNPRVREIVIKPKELKKAEVDRYRSFVGGLIKKDSSGKIRLADRNLTLPEALPRVSIAVHDMFSTPTMQTVFCDIPTIVLLREQQEVLEGLSYYERLIELGIFLKHIDLLAPTLTRWINHNFVIPEDIKQRFKEDWCGDGNPSIEEQMAKLLLS